MCLTCYIIFSYFYCLLYYYFYFHIVFILFYVCFVFFFFFSSRRRHTRYIGDRSSDVCSSDLRRPLRGEVEAAARVEERDAVHRDAPGGPAQTGDRFDQRGLARPGAADEGGDVGGERAARSEERRVGKECRAGWAAENYNRSER